MFRQEDHLIPIVGILIMLALLLCSKLHAEEFHVLELKDLSMEYKQHRNYRDSYFPQYETINGHCAGYNNDGTLSTECMTYGAGVNFDLSIVKFKAMDLFWNNKVDMDATNRQVRQVGWDWEVGPKFDKVSVFYHHHSRHLMESATVYNEGSLDEQKIKYPLRDEYVIRFNFYHKD